MKSNNVIAETYYEVLKYAGVYRIVEHLNKIIFQHIIGILFEDS